MEHDFDQSQFGQAPMGTVASSDRNLLLARFQKQRDEQIQLAVTTALHWDLAVPRHSVVVRVVRGWVTLTGKVDRVYQKSCAESDARLTPGVAGVTNEIECEQVG
jgi:osmotically-inducible protein OsmY